MTDHPTPEALAARLEALEARLKSIEARHKAEDAAAMEMKRIKETMQARTRAAMQARIAAAQD